VYYFERSGDLNYEAESEGVPVLEASWDAAREAERLRSLGLELMAGGGTRSLADLRSAVDQSIARLEEALVQPNSVSELAADAMAVQDAAYEVANTITALAGNRA
jgi:hypothetical protein